MNVSIRGTQLDWLENNRLLLLLFNFLLMIHGCRNINGDDNPHLRPYASLFFIIEIFLFLFLFLLKIFFIKIKCRKFKSKLLFLNITHN